MAGEEIDLVDEILGDAARDWRPGTSGSTPPSETPTEAPEPAAAQATEVEPSAAATVEPVAVGTSPAVPEIVLPAEAASAESASAESASAESVAAMGTAADDAAPGEAITLEGLAPAPIAPADEKRRPGLARRLVGFALVFAIVGTAVTTLMVGAAAGVTTAYQNRVIPGVRVGSLDVSGMTHDQLVAALTSSYAYLSQGKVTIATPRGSGTLTYKDAGRVANVDEMAYAALAVGHSGDFIADALTMAHTALTPITIPIAIDVDATAIARHIRDLLNSSRILPVDAAVTGGVGAPSVSKASTGGELDEKAISATITTGLASPSTPAELKVGSAFVTLEPQISDKDAEDAIAAAQRMGVDLTLSWSGLDQLAVAGSSQTPGLSDPQTAPSATSAAAKTFVVPADTVRGWIVFGTLGDGSYGAVVDSNQVQTYLSTIAGQVGTKATEPSVVYDSTGKPTSLKGGKDGVGIDLNASAQVIESYLETLAAGGNAGPMTLVEGPVHPKITIDTLSQLQILNGGKGQWTTTFYPDISNGFGTNIRLPASLLNGQVVAPGQQFDFLAAVGPIDSAHGYKLGGVIEHGKSNHTGAIGGGICSASTTMFNAAAWSGLQIDERHAHAYYINRYPVGLDATVFSNGYQSYDLKWTNDTAYPIVIRAWATYGSTSHITVQLWSMPLDRTVVFSAPYKANLIHASDSTVYTSALPAGTKNRAEYPTDGFSTSRTRTVTDSTGTVIHQDTWVSHYIVVNGILEIGTGGASTPTPTPHSGTATPPAATPAIVRPRLRRAA